MGTIEPESSNNLNPNVPQEAQAIRRDAGSDLPNNIQEPALPKVSIEKNNNPVEESHGMPNILKFFIVFIFIGIIGILFFSFISKFFFKGGKTEDVTLTYWGLWEPESVMHQVLVDFEKQNPHIHINYIQEDPKLYTKRLITRIKAGNGPDIFRFHNSWMPMLINVLSPLPNSVISKQEFARVFYPVMQDDLIQNGALYAVPLGIDTLALFTNNTLFQAAGLQPPVSWSDFLSTARTLTVKDDMGKIKTAGAAIGTYDNVTHASDIMSMLFLQNGADITDFSKKQQNASDALLFYTSFSNSNNSVWDQTLENSINAFAKGNVGMYFGYSWDVFTINAINPALQFSIHPVPHLPGREITIANYWVEGVSNKSMHQKEAFVFMNYLSQKDTMQKIYAEEAKTRLFGELYSRSDLSDLFKDDKIIYPFIAQAPKAKSTYFAGETQDNYFSSQMNGYLGNTVRSVLSNTSPQSALDTLSKGEMQVLQQYVNNTPSQ